jgi:hypothetical protein
MNDSICILFFIITFYHSLYIEKFTYTTKVISKKKNINCNFENTLSSFFHFAIPWMSYITIIPISRIGDGKRLIIARLTLTRIDEPYQPREATFCKHIKYLYLPSWTCQMPNRTGLETFSLFMK